MPGRSQPVRLAGVRFAGFTLATQIGMFDERAFRSWKLVLAGASVVSILFLAVMLMVEEVAGGGARLSRAAVTISLAAFVGYVGTAWIIRRSESKGGRA